MMNHPSLNELVDKAGCRYMLVSAVAKRARQLVAEGEYKGDAKAVSIAIEEFHNGTLKIVTPEQ